MTVRELYAAMDKMIPSSLSCDWDNDGLMCCPDSAREVRRVLVALDATAEVCERAIREGYDLILTHHPFIFKGLRSIDDEAPVSAKAINLIKAGISVMSFHTRLDALEGGVNDSLCKALGLSEVEVFDGEGMPIGRVGELADAISLGEFAAQVKAALGCPFVLVADAGLRVKRVAVLGGEGGDFVREAKAAGADTYVSGRLGYHTMTDAPDAFENSVNLIEAGHFYTEQVVCAALCDMVRAVDADIVCDIFNSNRIKAI